MTEIQKYSRFVARMKFLLPLGGGLILAAVIAWPFINQKEEVPLTNVDEQSTEIVENHMIKPRYASTDKHGRPFEVEAEWGKPKDTTHEEADLITPHGKLTTEKHGDVIVDSKHGHYDKNTNILKLDTDVVLTTGDGYRFESQQADVDIQNKIVEGGQPISGHGPAGELESQDGFRIEETEDGNRILTLKGKSRVVINASTLKKVNDQ